MLLLLVMLQCFLFLLSSELEPVRVTPTHAYEVVVSLSIHGESCFGVSASCKVSLSFVRTAVISNPGLWTAKILLLRVKLSDFMHFLQSTQLRTKLSLEKAAKACCKVSFLKGSAWLFQTGNVCAEECCEDEWCLTGLGRPLSSLWFVAVGLRKYPWPHFPAAPLSEPPLRMSLPILCTFSWLWLCNRTKQLPSLNKSLRWIDIHGNIRN